MDKYFKLHCQDSMINLEDPQYEPAIKRLSHSYRQLLNRYGKGNDFLGWLDLPEHFDLNLMLNIKDEADRLASFSEAVVVIGIGGSYLGARAVIEILTPYFPEAKSDHIKRPQILFAGNNLSEDYLFSLLKLLDQKEYAVIVVSKSGTTTEPAIAFRIIREHCEKKYGKEGSASRIVAITDPKSGALRQMAVKNGYTTFSIPQDVGGRYSVLTPAGLLPIAIAGFDIKKIVFGAQQMRTNLFENQTVDKNIAMRYALLRYLLYQSGKKVELMTAYEPKFFCFIEWFKQLFGESEGKEGKGIFPAGAIFSTDLHSLGQYIQEGERLMFETVLSLNQNQHYLPIPKDEEDLDKLNYLIKRSIQNINHVAEQGTRMAHVAGGVPNLQIELARIGEEEVGALIYFFEFSCALSGYLLDVNPFDQPGVEAYKKNMFKLLGK
ncbi:glucose-6-phosphate isomerase [Bacteroidales bacterium OttesenSCG-928-B11]|nr:glucose-6-phosphate isomerase [Bacteroidales bacterium OttesenSCG-928-C03]MDL2311963.1 glucose-6-phosphate isomerase [Bacteroidales bacterium OttesenSCG-928-B11]